MLSLLKYSIATSLFIKEYFHCASSFEQGGLPRKQMKLGVIQVRV